MLCGPGLPRSESSGLLNPPPSAGGRCAVRSSHLASGKESSTCQCDCSHRAGESNRPTQSETRFCLPSRNSSMRNRRTGTHTAGPAALMRPREALFLRPQFHSTPALLGSDGLGTSVDHCSNRKGASPDLRGRKPYTRGHSHGVRRPCGRHGELLAPLKQEALHAIHRLTDDKAELPIFAIIAGQTCSPRTPGNVPTHG